MRFFRAPGRLVTYQQGFSLLPDIRTACRSAEEITGIDWEIKKPLLENLGVCEREMARRMAETRLVGPGGELSENPLFPEIEYECRTMTGESVNSPAVYEGMALQELAGELIGDEVKDFSIARIVFTDRLFGTLEEGRVHLRMILFGMPTLVSIPGIVRAPARPRDYYLKREELSDKYGRSIAESKALALSDDRFLTDSDKRLNEVAAGLIIQTVFFHIYGNPFCSILGCRLYNAHWQRDLIACHIEGKFCKEHAEEIQKIRTGRRKN